jgi:hypothetical protein
MGMRNRLTTVENAGSVTRTLSVIAQNQSVRDAEGRILIARMRLPHKVLEPWPIGYQVVDYDTTEGSMGHTLGIPSAGTSGKTQDQVHTNGDEHL